VTQVRRILKYCWFIFVMNFTGFLPDFKAVMRLRGMLLKPCFRKCGRNLQIASNAMIVYTSGVEIGNDVYIAYGAWIHGHGGVTLEDESMLGPYVVVVSNDHVRQGDSYRFGDTPGDPVRISSGAWVGAHAVITAGVTVGRGALCAAGAVVTRDVPDHAVVGGVPAKVIRQEDTGGADT
jgi:maltose O-acetyltransferase